MGVFVLPSRNEKYEVRILAPMLEVLLRKQRTLRYNQHYGLRVCCFSVNFNMRVRILKVFSFFMFLRARLCTAMWS